MGGLARWLGVFGLIVASCVLLPNVAYAAKHQFAVHDKVPLFANKVGPFHNPSETYQYYR